jgi:hypothetical protein
MISTETEEECEKWTIRETKREREVCLKYCLESLSGKKQPK